MRTQSLLTLLRLLSLAAALPPSLRQRGNDDPFSAAEVDTHPNPGSGTAFDLGNAVMRLKSQFGDEPDSGAENQNLDDGDGDRDASELAAPSASAMPSSSYSSGAGAGATSSSSLGPTASTGGSMTSTPTPTPTPTPKAASNSNSDSDSMMQSFSSFSYTSYIPVSTSTSTASASAMGTLSAANAATDDTSDPEPDTDTGKKGAKGKKIRYKQCPSVGTVTEIKIEPCEGGKGTILDPCHFHAGSNYTISLSYVTPIDSQHPRSNLIARDRSMTGGPGSDSFPYSGQSFNACSYTDCPIVANTTMEYTYEFVTLNDRFDQLTFNVTDGFEGESMFCTYFPVTL